MDQVSIQVVWAHPRVESLTAAISQDIILELSNNNVRTDELDLYRSGFDSILREPDEPDWENPEKQYSEQVMKYATRAMAADAVVFVFPVWWYSVPALLKGYIERVWNYGLFYGTGSTHNIAAIRWIGLAGHPRERFLKRNYEKMMDLHLNTGIAKYCGVGDSSMKLLYNTLGEDISDFSHHIRNLRRAARSSATALVRQLSSRGIEQTNEWEKIT